MIRCVSDCPSTVEEFVNDILLPLSKGLSQTKQLFISSSGTQYEGLAESFMAFIGYSNTAEAKEFKVPTTFSPYLKYKDLNLTCITIEVREIESGL